MSIRSLSRNYGIRLFWNMLLYKNEYESWHTFCFYLYGKFVESFKTRRCTMVLTTQRDVFDPFFDSIWRNADERNIQNFSPAANIIEEKTKYLLEVFIPGMKKEDINIEVKDNVLTISGERKQERKVEKDAYYHYESAFGKFSRSWALDGLSGDTISAEYKDGVLRIEISKPEEKKPKQISVN